MSSYKIISQDNHVIEPIDLWTSRAESKFAWRVPHVENLGGKGRLVVLRRPQDNRRYWGLGQCGQQVPGPR